MAEIPQCVLVEGGAVRCDMTWEPTERCVLHLHGIEWPIVVPFFPSTFPEMMSHISSLCVREPDGYLALDLIISGKDCGPVTSQARNELLARFGFAPIYLGGADFGSSPILASVRELERELIAYLTRHPEKMRGMHPDAFEKLVAELMAGFGFDVGWTARNPTTAADIIAFKTDSPSGLRQTFIVECKRYAEKNRVGVEIARALYGAKVDERFSNALLVTTSFFEEGVEKFAARRWDFQLRDFHGLVEWLNAYRPPREGKLHMEGRTLKVRL